MHFADFALGTEFVTGGERWRVTDLGRRTVIAVCLDDFPDDPSWYEGPPYDAMESVFDEAALPECQPCAGDPAHKAHGGRLQAESGSLPPSSLRQTMPPAIFPGQYILDGTRPVPEPDLLTWGRWLGTADRHVAATTLPDGTRVSTVFLGLDHRWGPGPPLLFETMVFDPAGEPQDCVRYPDWPSAEQGHVAAVARCTTPAP